MAKSKETYNKKEKEKTKQKKKKDKEYKKEQRKAGNTGEKKTFEEMLSYVDEYGNYSSTPPDPKRMQPVNLADIEIGVPKREKEDVVRKGKVNYFNDEKGYGFIIDQSSGDSIFVHANGLTEPIKVGNRVTFEVERGAKGLNAIYVKVIG